jgi:hypothetical protein
VAKQGLPAHLEELDDSTDALAAFDPEVPEAPRNSVGLYESWAPASPTVPRAESSRLSSPVVPQIDLNSPATEPSSRLAAAEFERLSTSVAQPATHNSTGVADDPQRSSFDDGRTHVEPKRPSVSLAALIGADLRPDANEVIAIGQALCRSIPAIPQQKRSVNALLKPDLNTVLVDAVGQVLIVDGEKRSVPESLWTIAAVLLELLPTHSHWLLRTRILSQAQSSPDSFTLNEFEQELSIYATADSASLICALYERWFTLHGKLANTSMVPTAAVETQKKPPAFVEHAVRTARGNYTLGAAIAATVLLVISGSIFLGRADTHAPVLPTATTDANPTALANITADVPTARLTPAADILVSRRAEDVVRRGRSAGPAKANSVQVRNTAGNAAASTADHDASAALSPSHAAIPEFTDIAAPSASVAPVQVPASARPPAVPRATANDLPVTAVIYSKADEGVTPPVLIVPRLIGGLRPQSPDVRWDILTVEVVVDTKGSVDGVRGLVAPRNMGETVLLTQALSAIKSWPFKPALKDGLPVAYRQVMQVRELSRDVP